MSTSTDLPATTTSSSTSGSTSGSTSASASVPQTPFGPPTGLQAVLAGLVALVILNTVAIITFRHDSANAIAAVGTISGPIAALVSAYFGIKVGAQSGVATAAAANQARAAADDQVKAALAHLDPAVAIPLARAMGILPAGDAGGSTGR